MSIKIHDILDISYTNGPGPHYVLWTQGCNFRCNGCFNPNTHDLESGKVVKINKILQDITNLVLLRRIRGITISGGEPLIQINGILELCRVIKENLNIGIVLFTGYTEEEYMEKYSKLDEFVDLIILGRFKKDLILKSGLRGSSNKKYKFNTDFYKLDDIEKIPEAELTITPDGVIITGIDPNIITDFGI